jgi:hypothetical protein
MKQLSFNAELKDYCHYFRVLRKKTFNEAKFKMLSNNFQFYYKVKINLGDIALEQEFKMPCTTFKK